MRKRFTSVVVIWFVVIGSEAIAESRNEFGAWFARSAGTATLIGKTEQFSLTMTSLRYARTISSDPSLKFRYTADVIPFAQLTDTSGTVRGKGASPIGFELEPVLSKRIRPIIGLRGGFLYFSDDIPRNGGARFNFTAALGAGLRITLSRRIDAQAGYEYHHISNNYRAPANPGFDSQLILAGLIFKR